MQNQIRNLQFPLYPNQEPERKISTSSLLIDRLSWFFRFVIFDYHQIDTRNKIEDLKKKYFFENFCFDVWNHENSKKIKDIQKILKTIRIGRMGTKNIFLTIFMQIVSILTNLFKISESGARTNQETERKISTSSLLIDRLSWFLRFVIFDYHRIDKRNKIEDLKKI